MCTTQPRPKCVVVRCVPHSQDPSVWWLGVYHTAKTQVCGGWDLAGVSYGTYRLQLLLDQLVQQTKAIKDGRGPTLSNESFNLVGTAQPVMVECISIV